MFLVILIKECRQSLLISDAHSLEFPLPVAFVQATELHGSLYAEILFQFIFSNLLVSVGVIDADERVAHLTEILSALISFVDCHHEAASQWHADRSCSGRCVCFRRRLPLRFKVVAWCVPQLHQAISDCCRIRNTHRKESSYSHQE